MTERETFIACGELLRELAVQCRAAHKFLVQHADEVQGTQTELMRWVAERQERVAGGLERCAVEGPDNLVQRRLQYKPGYRAWRGPDSPERAFEQVVELNNLVAEVLDDEAEKSVPEAVTEHIQDLTRQVNAINRKISLALVVSTDL
jgi:hypothetical protein